MKLKDKVAVITGAAGGIGSATARLFAREGAKLCLSDMNEASLAEIAAQMRELGAEVSQAKLDVTDSRAVEALFEVTADTFGRIDILINNAGAFRDAVAWRMTDEQWDLVIDVNLKGTFNCCRAVLPFMRRQNYGRIVNTSSISALGNPGQINYSAAKAGISAMTRTLALEGARYGINVNCVAPGLIDTPMSQAMPESLRREMIERVPLRKMGRPEDIASMHLYLVSEEAGYITGQTLFVDGGISIGI